MMAQTSHMLQATLGVAALLATTSPAFAATCMDDVQALTRQLGMEQSAPPQNGAPGAGPPATTESRGIPPEVTSRLSGNAALGNTGGNTVAARRSSALAALQSARAAAAQGNEQACSAQLAKARAIFEQRQP